MKRRDVLKAGLFAPLAAFLGVKEKPKGIFSQEFLDEKPSLGGDLDAGYEDVGSQINQLLSHDGELYFRLDDGRVLRLTGDGKETSHPI